MQRTGCNAARRQAIAGDGLWCAAGLGGARGWAWEDGRLRRELLTAGMARAGCFTRAGVDVLLVVSCEGRRMQEHVVVERGIVCVVHE